MDSYIKDKVCIVVVLFNPNKSQIGWLERLSVSSPIVCVDNSSNNNTIKGVEYIPLHNNQGIAAAQNVGIRYAKEHGYKYVLMLDQDSSINLSFIEDIYNDYIRIKSNDSKIGFLGPIFIDRDSNQEYKNYTDKTKPYSKVPTIISSGSLISLEILEEVGLMDESLFIDLVDFEWCWRANSKGFTGYITRNVKMTHSIGKEYHNWHGFVLGISASFRYYYQYRNTLWLTRRSYVPLSWKTKSLLRRIIDMVLVPIASKNGWQVIKNMILGIKDGLFKKRPLHIKGYDERKEN